MFPGAQDEGWVPAITGLFTLAVWRHGRSSVIARLRAVWVLFVVAALILLVVVIPPEDDGVLRRWAVYVGWGSFIVFAFFSVYLNARLGTAVRAAPPERIADVFMGRWWLAVSAAWAPVAWAGSSVQQGVDPAVWRYPTAWALAVTLPLLAMLVPSMKRLRGLDEERAGVDGQSVIAALSAPTAKSERKRTSKGSLPRN